jgi:predicted outer membrane repeat protein
MKRNKGTWPAAIVCMSILILCPAGRARTIYVANDGPADFRTIQAAIKDANNGDTVIIQRGTYTGPGNRDIDFKGKALTVRGPDPNDWGAIRATVIDCQGTQNEPHRGFLFTTSEGSDSVLSGLTITGGYAPRISLGIFKETVGGGICCNKTGPTISHCIVSGNSAQTGGGGLFAYGGSPTVRYCQFRSNSASSGGGAIEVYGGRMVVSDCAVVGNYSYSCGGVYAWASTLLLDNCLIRRNEGVSWGAGVCVEFGVEARILNCTVIENCSEKSYSPAVHFVNGPGPTRLANCIIWGNSCAGTRSLRAQMNLSYPDHADYCCIEGWDGTWAGLDTFSKDPLLTRDAHLQPDSPCIDAGDPNSDDLRTTQDIDGEVRVHGARVDIGCDEFIDTDEDGLADVWERRYFGDLASAEVTDNPDGDLWDNKTEYLRGSNPRHAPTAYYVDPARGNDAWDGLSASRDGTHGPKATIRAALGQAEARDLDRIVLTQGWYAGEDNRNIDFAGKEVAIGSTDPNDPAVVAATVIDCNGVHPPMPLTPSRGQPLNPEMRRAFILQSGEGPDAHIEGLTIVNGSATGDGGAITCAWSSAQIANCSFRDNAATDSGGAIFCRNGSTAVIHCTLEQNRASYGGAVASSSVDGHTLIANCTLRANVAASYGGGVVCGSGTETVGCLIAMNEAQGGGDLLGRDILGGGGVRLEGTGAVLANCTIAGNIARAGSGLASGCVENGKGTAALYNCIVWGNSGGPENQIAFSPCCRACVVDSRPVQLHAYSSCVEGGANLSSASDGVYLPYFEDTSCLHADPCFLSPQTSDYRLRPDSPCVDTGTDAPIRVPLEVDGDGNVRIADGDGDGAAIIDMGAWELPPRASPTAMEAL